MNLIEKGLEKGLIKFDDEKKFITYVYQNKKRNYTNPEEKIQTETFLKLMLVYGYSEKRIRHYVSVKMGTTGGEADIIVYNDNDCFEPYIIIECKKSDVSEQEFEQASDQAFSYAYATPKNIKYIWITSSIKNKYYEFNKDKDERKDAPDIPSYGVKKLAKYKYAKGGFDPNITEDKTTYGTQKFFDLKEVTENELTRRFKQAHNSLWAGGEMNPSQAFDELDKLIFCKIWDEIYTIDEDNKIFRPRKNGEPYLFQTFADETIKELSNRIKSVYEQGRKKDPEVFGDDIRLSSQKVKTVVGYLEGINLSKTDLDSKGKAFETFMGSYFRGDFGQFFTPRNIVKFIVDVLPINNDSRVLDTSCGSGGFLLYALDKVRAQASEYYNEGSIEHYKYWHDFAEHNLFGIEINNQIEEWYRIVAVVSMPQTAFMHTGAGVKSSVLFLRKLSDEQAEKITNQKKSLQEKIKTENNFQQKIETFEDEKKEILKNHTGFENITGETEKKTIEKTNAFKDWKNRISAKYSQKLNEFKEELADIYQEEKRKILADYQIFMAIAEDIGYDATGRATGNNELEVIGKELKKFIEHI